MKMLKKLGLLAMVLITICGMMSCLSSTKEKVVSTPKVVTADVLTDVEIVLTDWVAEPGWDYCHGIDKDQKQALCEIGAGDANGFEVKLDYSLNSASGWSEPKVKKTIDPAIVIRNHNILEVTIRYPETLKNIDIKAFGKDADGDKVIEANVAPETIKESDGWITGISSIIFAKGQSSLGELTLGVVGKGTDFIGSIYIEKVELKAAIPEGAVDITSVPGDGSKADLSKMPTEVKLSNKKATKETLALASYLHSLSDANQVMFGHQNALHKQVYSPAEGGSDVKENTGSYPGVVGLDTLSLTGNEMSAATIEEAVQRCIDMCVKAASEGSIITLSTHFPNFTDKRFEPREGFYTFKSSDFPDSKNLNGNCAENILPGQEYNDRFTAYLDIIVDFAKGLQKEKIPVIFRPFHENNGGWFWWGSMVPESTYKALFRYTVDYLTAAGVNNFLYTYSPNGPFVGVGKYLERYPGDDYVDIIAFDYYDDYNKPNMAYRETYLNELRSSCEAVAKIAESKGKIPAISETGSRVMRADGDNNGLAIMNNPMTGHDWFTEVMNVASETGMPYYLLWANFFDTNCYVPYKRTETTGHEMVNEFIDFYNEPNSIFANDTNFYTEAVKTKVKNTQTNKNVIGYMASPVDNQVILDDTELVGSAKNAKKVYFSIEIDSKKVLDLPAKKKGDVYVANLTKEIIDTLPKTNDAKITFRADNAKPGVANFVSIGKEKPLSPPEVFDDFEYYSGNDSVSANAYPGLNAAGGCTATMGLSSEYKSEGEFGGAFNYHLICKGSEVWAGFGMGKELRIPSFFEYNALNLWVKPDGYGQKFVIQFQNGKEELEMHLADFVKGTEAAYITIPFSSFIGKNTMKGLADPTEIKVLRFWCNSIPKNVEGMSSDDNITFTGKTYDLNSTIYLDDIRAVKLTEEELENLPEIGYYVTEAPMH